MADLGAIAAAAGGLKAAGDIIKAMIGLKVSAEVQAKIIELQTVIMSTQGDALAAQADQFALLQRVRELEEEVARAKTWNTERQKYELQPLGSGAFAYALKPEAQGAEPPHWLCTNCYDKGQRAVLQNTGRTPDKSYKIYACPACKSSLQTSWNVSPESIAEKAKPKKKPAQECPKCGEPELRLERSEPHPQLGTLGVNIRHMKCDGCGFTEQHQHST